MPQDFPKCLVVWLDGSKIFVSSAYFSFSQRKTFRVHIFQFAQSEPINLCNGRFGLQITISLKSLFIFSLKSAENVWFSGQLVRGWNEVLNRTKQWLLELHHR